MEGVRPDLASYHLAKDHGLRIGREALRQIMTQAGLWRAEKQTIKDVHVWRQRRSCVVNSCSGTRANTIGWKAGEKLYLISMIDDATSQLLAR
jgi:hypothetical protein